MTTREYFLSTADRDQWSTFMPDQKSAFGSIGYAEVAERFLGRVPRLYVVESDRGWIAHPMLLRPLCALPFGGVTNAQWDAGTPEYTGPRIFGDGEELEQAYIQGRRNLALREGIVSEFAHLDPWAHGHKLLHDGRFYDRDIIWMDATLDPNFLWTHHLEARCRKHINKAIREGLRADVATSDDDIREFVRIYQGTMMRAGALSSYLYPYEFFIAIRDRMQRNARFLLTRLGDLVISAILILYDEHSAYSYLGGSDAAFNEFRPSNFHTWHVLEWAHKAGIKRFVLGGGYRPNDGIFQFKAAFSPLRQPFYVYKKIHLGEEYERLDRESRSYHQRGDEEVDYFPSYRYVKA